MLLTPYYSYAEECNTPPWNPTLFTQWFVVVISCTFAILLLICTAGIVSDYFALKRKSAPRPLIILMKNLLPLPCFIYDKLAGRRLEGTGLNAFVNKTIWVEWDIRWVAANSTQGIILDIISNSTGVGLLIQLRDPIIDTSENVIFYPKKTSISASRFRYAAVNGNILPTHKPEDYVGTHGPITATLTVL
jgi:hypothetical protein